MSVIVPALYRRVCRCCGAGYETNYQRKKTCSKECGRVDRILQARIKAGQSRVIAKCRICGIRFVKFGQAVTCSKACRYEYRMNEFRKWYCSNRKLRKYSTCLQCGASLPEYGRGNTRTCSRECFEKRRRFMNWRLYPMYAEKGRLYALAKDRERSAALEASIALGIIERPIGRKQRLIVYRALIDAGVIS